ncbi:MAG: Sua5/YciO/YrdC/YwlC family protein [Rhizomicrobium sp.]
MRKPDLIVGRDERTRNGALRTYIVQQARNSLLKQGFVLLPSDTCYSLAMLAADEAAHATVNRILNRKKAPLSLAFPSYLEVQGFVDMDAITAALLERFCPGPLTVVCRATDKLPEKFLTHTIASTRHTIGVRIPDSIVERDIAASTRYPLTTVAIRDPKTNVPVRDFGKAIEILSDGIAKVGDASWIAIEGGEFYSDHSTVVEAVGGAERVRLLREGDIPFRAILDIAQGISGLMLEGWR